MFHRILISPDLPNVGREKKGENHNPSVTNSSYETNAGSNFTRNSENEPRNGILPFTNSLNIGEGGEGANLISSKGNIETNVDVDEQNDNLGNPNFLLQNLRAKNIDRIILGHLNINFVEKKFETLVPLVKDKLDIFLISETKIDQSFPPAQFTINGYHNPFRRDRDKMGGGLLLYARDDITCKEIKPSNLPSDIECIFIEIRLRNKKYIVVGGYNPHRNTGPYFLNHIGKALDTLLCNYDNFLLIGDFNCTQEEKCMIDFCETHNLENLIKVPTCFKNPMNPSSIDVILTNRKNSFQNTMAIETGLSDHHKMTLTALKVFIRKKNPITVNYRSYKNFNETNFRIDLYNALLNCNKQTLKYDEFKTILMTVLNSHAPTKQRILRGNNQPFMNKTLSKAFMYRSKLKNRYNKSPTQTNKKEYRRQRNFCVNLLAREKKKFYNNLDLRIFDDNKTFWKNIKPLFSNKQHILQKNITLVEKDEITSNDKEVAEKLNIFFTEAVKNLEINPYIECGQNNEIVVNKDDSNDIDSIDKIILEYNKHPSILKIKEEVKVENKFKFADSTPYSIQNEIRT